MIRVGVLLVSSNRGSAKSDCQFASASVLLRSGANLLSTDGRHPSQHFGSVFDDNDDNDDHAHPPHHGARNEGSNMIQCYMMASGVFFGGGNLVFAEIITQKGQFSAAPGAEYLHT